MCYRQEDDEHWLFQQLIVGLDYCPSMHYDIALQSATSDRRMHCAQEDDARWFFQQLIVGLDYCHRMGVVNRDIKLENTLLDASPKPLVKITDFGYCKASNDSLPKSKVGTPGYTGALCASSWMVSSLRN